MECIPFESELSVRFLDGVLIIIRLQLPTGVHRVVKVALSTVAGCALPLRQARQTPFPLSASPLRIRDKNHWTPHKTQKANQSLCGPLNLTPPNER